MANTKVTSGVIKDDAVGADQLASNSVVTASINDNAITTAKIADDAILTAKISNSAITNAKMSSNSVDSDQYVDGSIDTAHIGDGQVTSAKLDTNIAVSGTLNVTGVTTLATHLVLGDDDIIKIGAGDDMHLFHSSNVNQLQVDQELRIQKKTGPANMIVATPDGAVELYYAGSKKLETASGGVTVTGDIQSSTKLITKTTNGEVIRFERASDSNRFSSITHNSTDAGGAFISFKVHDGSTATSQADVLHLLGSGRVGIGTSSPNATLNVNGTIRAENERFLAGRETASAPAYAFHDDADTGMFNVASNTLCFSTAGSEKMRLGSTGRLGIGTDSASQLLHIKSTTDAAIKLEADSDNANEDDNAYIEFSQDGGLVTGYVGYDTNTNEFTINQKFGAELTFKTSDTERARFSSAGKLFINTTAAVRGSEQVSIDGGSADCFALKTHAAGAVIRKQSVTNGFLFLFENSSASAVGSITTDASNTTYNTSSDYRLKENIEPMQNGLKRLNQLNPVKFSWKETGIVSEGFIAHEVDEIFSDCIYGKKDGEEIQSMDYGRITPLLVKAIQELSAEVEDLKAKLEEK